MELRPYGERGVLLVVRDHVEALAAYRDLLEHPIPGTVDIVPSAQTVLLTFDHQAIAYQARRTLEDRRFSTSTMMDGRTVQIPTRYDGEDLAEVAQFTGLSEAEVIERHTESEWTVAFVGFSPGFGYLVGGDPVLQVPRRQSPRTKVPAGAVALAGEYSAVYPRQSPGGWQLIGHTDLPMWDLAHEPPTLLTPGTRVRFVDQAGAGR